MEKITISAPLKNVRLRTALVDSHGKVVRFLDERDTAPSSFYTVILLGGQKRLLEYFPTERQSIPELLPGEYKGPHPVGTVLCSSEIDFCDHKK